MYTKFENLPEEKRNRIIDAAIEEFAKNGYKKGSTNNIVKKAEISKGLLFHYFGNKKNLYLYLFDYIMDFFTPVIKEQIKETKPTDVFERLKTWTLIKLRIFSQYPLMYEFLVKAIISTPDELENEIQKRYNKIYSENIGIFFEEIDISKFRENIDSSKGIEILLVSIEGLLKKYIQGYRGREEQILKDVDGILKDIDEYIEILKWGLYKSK